MKPDIIYGARQFTATSGNRILHVTDLGPDGIHAAWDQKPSARDMDEFAAWVASKLGGPVTETRHNGGQAEARRAYKEWKKS